MNRFLPEYKMSVFPKVISQKSVSQIILSQITLKIKSVLEGPIHQNDFSHA